MDFKNFRSSPRSFALQLVEEGHTTKEKLLMACLGFLSYDDVCEMLDNNELSPRFFDDEEDDEDDEEDDDEEDENYMYCDEEISNEEKYACDLYNERYVLSYAD